MMFQVVFKKMIMKNQIVAQNIQKAQLLWEKNSKKRINEIIFLVNIKLLNVKNFFIEKMEK